MTMGGESNATDTLIDDVKNYLQITWEDEATDRRIGGLIASGKAYLDRKLGEQGDYTVPGTPRTLLFEYVRYARDAALDVYENNYRSLILMMQNEVRANAVEVEST